MELALQSMDLIPTTTRDIVLKDKEMDIVAITLMLLISIPGIAFNAWSISIALESVKAKCVYGIIWIGFSIPNIVMLMFSCGWSVSAILTDLSGIRWLGNISAHLANTSFYSSVYVHFLGTLNRLVAICFPLKYGQMFRMQTTMITVGIIWLYCFSLGTPYHIEGCSYTFRRETLGWEFDESFCGWFESLFIDFVFLFALHGIMVSIDGYIAVKMRATSKVPKQQRHKQEVRFFIQSCSSNVLFILCETCFTILRRFVHGNGVDFLLGTMMWQMQHALDGLIPILFQRRNLCSRKRKSPVTIVTTK
ncbi:hypothetical protein Tcan_12185 [Toxocara canis]|uniref:G-protein coupled receptors family 1 profile domain-containing protein n=1 Tax=Toxocara canis TaxID=6265 RepID=A0A0B2USB5_TOXCA|nr:hypothetical protein Tcan_12185 [Toxocara canis]